MIKTNKKKKNHLCRVCSRRNWLQPPPPRVKNPRLLIGGGGGAGKIRICPKFDNPDIRKMCIKSGHCKNGTK